MVSQPSTQELHLNQRLPGNLETYWRLEHFFPFNQITKQRTKDIFTPVRMQQQQQQDR
jgi:hypothetical protein